LTLYFFSFRAQKFGATGELGVLEDFDFCSHSFSKRSEAGCHELERNVKQLLVGDCGDVNLNLEEKHDVAGDGLGDFKEVFLMSALEVIYKEAARVPIVSRAIEHLELDVGGLASLHSRVVLVFGAVRLLGHVRHVCQVLGRNCALRPKDVLRQRLPDLVLGDPCQLYGVIEFDCVLLALLQNAFLLLPHTCTL